MKMLFLLLAGATLSLASCSQDQTAMERAEDMPAGTTIKGADGSKIKKQDDGDIKIKDAEGNKVKKDADDGELKVK
ncbi:PepSY domain-containing protein [Hymenobacter defluvii]|uniref:PepSY domain-containing protein n=1 Tax=Hymenobacter defluvii TaxID=2054411 RepID=A0ABS3T8Y3_9BACT|nr:PepSY domain-containing protein [Hymenobacter defluvii]MBO3270099.1 hypothetical protein [Hymenobacter defluvii]